MFECHVALGLFYLAAIIICYIHVFFTQDNPIMLILHIAAEIVILAIFIAYLCVGVDWHSTDS